MPTDPEVHVRPATAADLPAIAAIYNEGIRSSLATFETRERSPDELATWLTRPHPLLVADAGGTVLGWVSGSSYRERACYAGIAEFSVYVAASARGRGVGDRLMSAFLVACREAGFWKVLSRIFPENAASLALCDRHGFRRVGIYEKHAQLGGVWRDVLIVERWLGPPD